MKNILFLGNSFTYFNDLPKMVQNLCTAENIEVYTDSVTRGGAYLHQFTDPADELSAKLAEKIAEKSWDIVILQDQSSNPARNPDDTVSACRKIAALFPENAEFLLYQTWSYRDNTDVLRSVKMTYPEMRTRLREGYAGAADAIGGRLIPVGDAFALATQSGVDVYCDDDYHPNANGSYTAACVFIRHIFGKTPSAYPENVSENAALLCRIASMAV